MTSHQDEHPAVWEPSSSLCCPGCAHMPSEPQGLANWATSIHTLLSFTPVSFGQQTGDVSFLWGKQMGMQGEHSRVSQCMQGVDSPWTQAKPALWLNSLQLGEFYLTPCQLTLTFAYRFGHWKKREQAIKKNGLGKTPFLLLPEAQFMSSFSPSHPLSVTLPQFCPAPHSALGWGNGWHGRFRVIFRLPLAFLHCSFCLPAPLPQCGPPACCSPSRAPAPMTVSPAVSPQCPHCHFLKHTYNRGAMQPLPLWPCLWHTTGPSPWCQSWPERWPAGGNPWLPAALGTTLPAMPCSLTQSLTWVQKTGAQPTPPAQHQWDRRAWQLSDVALPVPHSLAERLVWAAGLKALGRAKLMENWHRVQASPALTEAEVTTCSLTVAAATHIKTWDFPPCF